MKFLPWLLLLSALHNPAFADTDADQHAIAQLLQHTWGHAEAALVLGPITIGAEHAVVGWTQGERGGRALLAQNAQGWRVLLCGGDALLDTATLRDAGVAAAQVKPLVAAAREAEQAIAPARVQQFARFQGLMAADEQATAEH
jgi:hypothetical protein